MAKYKEILVRKAETGEKREKEQEKLRQESGIRDTGYQLKEKSWAAVILDVVKKAWFVAYAALAFIGAVMLLHPESRDIILQIFRLR